MDFHKSKQKCWEMSMIEWAYSAVKFDGQLCKLPSLK